MSTDAQHPEPDAVSTALRQVLGPLARLAVARGVTHDTLDELLKQALVDSADRSHADLPPHRRVSRITTATGIHRREVSRLLLAVREGAAQHTPSSRSHANELFAHWRTARAYCDLRGSPAELPRQGPAPSFETLAHTITRDVHPRSLLDELLRLGLAALDPERDTVRLVREAFVPQGDEGRMVAALGRNVGSHLEGAIDNLLQDNRRHFEQALFAEGLSDESMAEFRQLVRDQWQALLMALVPALEAMVARDARPSPTPTEAGLTAEPATQAPTAAKGKAPAKPIAATPAAPPLVPKRQHVRLGLYTFAQELAPVAANISVPEPKP